MENKSLQFYCGLDDRLGEDIYCRLGPGDQSYNVIANYCAKITIVFLSLHKPQLSFMVSLTHPKWVCLWPYQSNLASFSVFTSVRAVLYLGGRQNT